MKKFSTALLSLTLVSTLTVSALALEESSHPALAVVSETTPAQDIYTIQITQLHTIAQRCEMVPLRAVAEELGFKVTWENGAVMLDNTEMHTAVTIGKDEYFVATSIEGMVGVSAPFSLGVPSYVSNGITFVPLSLFDALLGYPEGSITMEGSKIIFPAEILPAQEAADTSAVQIANPFVPCDTLQAAEQLAGFSLTVPDTIAGYDNPTIEAIENALIQIIWTNGEHEFSIRKGVGTEDISGDYNTYAQTNTIAVGNLAVTMKGEKHQIHVATWSQGGYAYAVRATESGISRQTMCALIQGIQ